MKDFIHIQVNKKLKDELIKEAQEKGISLNAYINILLSERVKQ